MASITLTLNNNITFTVSSDNTIAYNNTFINMNKNDDNSIFLIGSNTLIITEDINNMINIVISKCIVVGDSLISISVI